MSVQGSTAPLSPWLSITSTARCWPKPVAPDQGNLCNLKKKGEKSVFWCNIQLPRLCASPCSAPREGCGPECPSQRAEVSGGTGVPRRAVAPRCPSQWAEVSGSTRLLPAAALESGSCSSLLPKPALPGTGPVLPAPWGIRRVPAAPREHLWTGQRNTMVLAFGELSNSPHVFDSSPVEIHCRATFLGALRRTPTLGGDLGKEGFQGPLAKDQQGTVLPFCLAPADPESWSQGWDPSAEPRGWLCAGWLWGPILLLTVGDREPK